MWPFKFGEGAAESVSMSWTPSTASDMVPASLELSQVAMEWKEVRNTMSADTGTPAFAVTAVSGKSIDVVAEFWVASLERHGHCCLYAGASVVLNAARSQ